MGSFFGNVHVRIPNGKAPKQFRTHLKRALSGGAAATKKSHAAISRTLVMTGSDRWIALFDEGSAGQDIATLESIAKVASRALETIAITVSVHDSDVLDMRLFENGEPRDTYNSMPEFARGPGDPPRETVAGVADAWRIALESGSPEQLRAAWDRDAVFVEDKLRDIAPMLGARPETLTAGAGDGDPPFEDYTSFVAKIPASSSDALSAPVAPPVCTDGKASLPTMLFGTDAAVSRAVEIEAKRWASVFRETGAFPSSASAVVANGTEVLLGESICAARAGSNEWRLHELHRFRREVVAALDGISKSDATAAVTAQIASFAWGNAFYMLDPWEHASVPEMVRRIRMLIATWSESSELRYIGTEPAPFARPRSLADQLGPVYGLYQYWLGYPRYFFVADYQCADLEKVATRLESATESEIRDVAEAVLYDEARSNVSYRSYEQLSDRDWVHAKVRAMDISLASGVATRPVTGFPIVARWCGELDRTVDASEIGDGSMELPVFLFGSASRVRSAIRKEAKRWVKSFTTSGSFPRPECRRLERLQILVINDRTAGFGRDTSEERFRIDDVSALIMDVRGGMDYDDEEDERRTCAAIEDHIASFAWGRAYFASCCAWIRKDPQRLAQTMRGAAGSWPALSSILYGQGSLRAMTFSRLLQQRFGSFLAAWRDAPTNDLATDLLAATDRMLRADREEVIRRVVPVMAAIAKNEKRLKASRVSDERWLAAHASNCTPEDAEILRAACDLLWLSYSWIQNG